MITIDNSFLVDRPASDVYDVFSQIVNIAWAFPTVREVNVVDDDHVSIGVVIKMGLLSLDNNITLEVTERMRPSRLVAEGVALAGKGLAAVAKMADKEGRTHISMILELEELGPAQSRIRYQLLADAHGNLKRVYDAVIKGQRAKLEREFIKNVAKILGTPIIEEKVAAAA
ncbi:MAG: SRPBCC family protein [Betaproteobacteria bacterium]|nr:SRPBCC family protein [Betaproteobacteria bacterium]